MDKALDIILYILSTLLGLAVGSFLNVCIYRIPRGKFWSNSRSYCPRCGAPIKAYDNIPLVSYIILKGRCRSCHERISPRYPIIESLNMILWIVNYAVFGMSYTTLIYDVLASTMIVVAMVDFDMTEIPDSSIVTIVILGLLSFIPNVGVATWQSMLIGAFCVSVPILILSLFGLMGMGDAKLYFALGLLFGWERILVIFLLSFVIGTVAALVNLAVIRHRANGAGAEAESTPESVENTPNNGISGQNANKTEYLGANIEEENIDKTEVNTIDIGVTEDSVAEEPNEVEADEFDRELEQRLESGRAIPFGPWIVVAAFITMYCGTAIIDLYMSLLGF